MAIWDWIKSLFSTPSWVPTDAPKLRAANEAELSTSLTRLHIEAVGSLLRRHAFCFLQWTRIMLSAKWMTWESPISRHLLHAANTAHRTVSCQWRSGCISHECKAACSHDVLEYGDLSFKVVRMSPLAALFSSRQDEVEDEPEVGAGHVPDFSEIASQSACQRCASPSRTSPRTSPSLLRVP